MFVTLTYNDESLPENPNRKNQSRDVQTFLKRLRIRLPQKIRYFICPEFGDKTERLHYHGILFGVSAFDTAAINDAWGNGFVQLGECNPKTIAYCTKYILKGDSRSDKQSEKPTRAFMSRNPGLGFKFAERSAARAAGHINSAEGIPGTVRLDGKTRPIGRYLTGKLHALSGTSLELLEHRRHQRASDVVEEYKSVGVGRYSEDDRRIRKQMGRNALARIKISQSKEKL